MHGDDWQDPLAADGEAGPDQRYRPRRGIYGNIKTAVEAILTGKERRYNRRFLAMFDHYRIEPIPNLRRESAP